LGANDFRTVHDFFSYPNKLNIDYAKRSFVIFIPANETTGIKLTIHKMGFIYRTHREL
jgi:hypothetical protein